MGYIIDSCGRRYSHGVNKGVEKLVSRLNLTLKCNQVLMLPLRFWLDRSIVVDGDNGNNGRDDNNADPHNSV